MRVAIIIKAKALSYTNPKRLRLSAYATSFKQEEFDQRHDFSTFGHRSFITIPG